MQKFQNILRRVFYSIHREIFQQIHWCNICGTESFFHPYGQVLRNHAQCPNCESLERHRFEYKHLQEAGHLKCSKLRVLHLAPENCFIKLFRKAWGKEYITADLSDPRCQLKMDVTAIESNEKAFDLILCNHVLEHVEDDQKALSEFFRVLKPKGQLILSVPIEGARTYEDFSITSPSQRLKAFKQPDHVRIYSLDIVERIKSAGFRVSIIKPKMLFTANELRLFSLTSSSTGILFVCKK